MSPSVTCYPQPGKAKSRLLLEAFAAGAGGRVVHTSALEEGPAAFYGTVGIEPLLQAAQRRLADWYYLDNSWFDATRGTHFRAVKNARQRGGATPGRARWQRLGLSIAPWRKAGRHVLLCPQSEYFMQHVAGWPMAAWQRWVMRRIESSTRRPIVVRPWSRDKGAQARALHEDLDDAWAVVTHSSAAANQALLAGVPVFVTTSDCAAFPVASGGYHHGGWNIDTPAYPDGRESWAASLAARQWTIDELRDGTAWRALNA